MYFQNYDSGQVSEEATMLVAVCVILGTVTDNLPMLQFLSYAVGLVIGLGTLLLNWDKYVEKFKDIYKKMTNGKP